MEPMFFTGPEEFRGWLENYHDKAPELWIGFYKKIKGRPDMFDYPAAVEIALCYGWIDGFTKSVDPYSYKVRFTPRKPNSNWSMVNIKRVEKLKLAGLMHPAGLAAYERRKPEKTGNYSFERDAAKLTVEMETELKEDKNAWQYFSSRSTSYKQTCMHWIMSAKQETTRNKRLRILIESSAAGLKIPPLRSNSDHNKQR